MNARPRMNARLDVTQHDGYEPQKRHAGHHDVRHMHGRDDEAGNETILSRRSATCSRQYLSVHPPGLRTTLKARAANVRENTVVTRNQTGRSVTDAATGSATIARKVGDSVFPPELQRINGRQFRRPSRRQTPNRLNSSRRGQHGAGWIGPSGRSRVERRRLVPFLRGTQPSLLGHFGNFTILADSAGAL